MQKNNIEYLREEIKKLKLEILEKESKVEELLRIINGVEEDFEDDLYE